MVNTYTHSLAEKIQTTRLKPKKSIPPKFLVPLQGQVVQDGDRFAMEAQYEGCPEPKITWFGNDGRPIKTGNGIRIEFGTNMTRLMIDKVQSIRLIKCTLAKASILDSSISCRKNVMSS